MKLIEGLGLSTITKFTYFLNTTINTYRAVILDVQIIESISAGRFEEFSHLKGITYSNAPKRYLCYIKTIQELSEKLDSKPDQIEMFLFIFGRALSPVTN